MTTRWSNEQAAGYLPFILSNNDPRPASEQLDDRYAHGGGYNPFEGFKLIVNKDNSYALQYPNDPPMRELSQAFLHEEKLVLFEGSWLAIIQPCGDHVITRVD